MAPVGDTLKTASDPWPSCQKNTIAPNTAANEIRLSRTALSGRSTDRKVRTSSTNVISAISAQHVGELVVDRAEVVLDGRAETGDARPRR